ncbi:MAG: hypothetical protein ACE5HK_00770 [Candidatus Methylomirabilales bacterium]
MGKKRKQGEPRQVEVNEAMRETERQAPGEESSSEALEPDVGEDTEDYLDRWEQLEEVTFQKIKRRRFPEREERASQRVSDPGGIVPAQEAIRSAELGERQSG